MNVKMEIKFQTKNVEKELAELPKRLRNKILRKAGDYAATPIVRECRRRSPKDSGALKKAFTKVTRLYKTKAVTVIGAKTRFSVTAKDGRTRSPTHYLFLLERGWVSHKGVKKGRNKDKTKYGKGGGKHHAGLWIVAGATRAKAAEAQERLKEKILEGLA